uniref:Uncharacterized protein n=1 Tax=Rhizophora mucronata TaxID=61149 RepID=A0A2P2Q555_RHIMU
MIQSSVCFFVIDKKLHLTWELMKPCIYLCNQWKFEFPRPGVPHILVGFSASCPSKKYAISRNYSPKITFVSVFPYQRQMMTTTTTIKPKRFNTTIHSKKQK